MSRDRITVVAAFLLLLGIQALTLVVHRTDFVIDDAPFFFRYAENLAAGNGFRFNAQEPPVWGGSAPLWPVVIAVGMKLGITAPQSSVLMSWLFTLTATGLFGMVAYWAVGIWGVVALGPLVASQYYYTVWAISGMESPLSLFCVAAACAVACGRVRGFWVGLVAGLCMVQKIDMIPLGLVLLLGSARWERKSWRTAAQVALGLVVCWYGFATWYFGSPLPVSFLTKVGTAQTMGWTWIGKVTLLQGSGILLVPLAAVGLAAIRRKPYLVAVSLASVAIPLVGYTLHPPAEPFHWYAVPLMGGLVLLAGCGLGRLLTAISGELGEWVGVGFATVLLAAFAWLLVRIEASRIQGFRNYLELVESQRFAAGQWVDHYAPADARVLTGYGNIAYFSNRFVYDTSFLNRRPEEVDLITTYQPEVWVDCPYQTKLTPEDYEAPPPYRVVQSFTRAIDSGKLDFFVVVMFRDDVPSPDLP